MRRPSTGRIPAAGSRGEVLPDRAPFFKQVHPLGIAADSISTVRVREMNPISNNYTVAGRQDIRRNEVALFANDVLRTAAKNGTPNQSS